MQYLENARIVRYGNQAGETYGKIELQHSADPNSVVVYLCGERLYPKEFTIFGNPIFTKEVCDLFDWKEDALKREHGKDYRLTATVAYTESKKHVDRRTVDSLAGIMSGTKDLESLSQLLIDRGFYGRNRRLNEYVIFGRYWLDQFGQVWTLNEKCEVSGMPLACTINEFNEMYETMKPNESSSWIGECHIPKEGESCPWCTKKFTIDDVKNGRFNIINGKIAHLECAKQYEHEREIYRIINQIVEIVYDEGVTFELLPNGYCNQPCCEHIPWFLCHTPDGDIKIGWRKRVISIEWQKNFKPFDMNIFNRENVTKWTRGIHAWGSDKAYEYLQKVKDIVNPKPEASY